MQTDNTTSFQSIPIRDGVLILSGYGIRVSLDRQHLAVEDGVGRQRRRGRFAKATSRLKRLVVLGRAGYLTLEAMRWLYDAGAALIHIDADGTLLATSANGIDDARLRRAQALALDPQMRLTVARELLRPKLQGQLGVVNTFGLANAEPIKAAISDLDGAAVLEAAILAEAQAAEAYWAAWADIPAVYARKDSVPDHWRSFGQRNSVLTQQPRNAINPLNALLNYLYTLLEAETRIALIARGLDPGLGFFHADTANRSSFADDVMEPTRPQVDAFVLNLARTKTFSADDFYEARDGGCRISLRMAHEIAGTIPTWRNLASKYADRVLRIIQGVPRPAVSNSPFRVKPRRTANRRDAVRPSHSRPLPRIPSTAITNACGSCGIKISERKRLYCNSCLPDRRAEALEQTVHRFYSAGPAKIAQMREAGLDPTNTPEARAKRAESVSRQRRAAVEWKDDGSTRGIDFARDILPQIQHVPVNELATTTRLSTAYCSKVRSGKFIPHKRHWRAFQAAADAREERRK